MIGLLKSTAFLFGGDLGKLHRYFVVYESRTAYITNNITQDVFQFVIDGSVIAVWMLQGQSVNKHFVLSKGKNNIQMKLQRNNESCVKVQSRPQGGWSSCLFVLISLSGSVGVYGDFPSVTLICLRWTYHHSTEIPPIIH